ncbi:MAG: 6-phosphogluconolactonase [Myxococcaceae bacterium]|nr:6-phosphogluconolactonase [Myxococcaceae bacterium]MCI0672149.1 6-phosphogluconolactonase [Myxococcaceae bacterium]
MSEVRGREPQALVTEAAAWMAQHLTEAVAARGRASLALSGGRSPVPILRALAALPVPWEKVDVYQVDERAVPPEHPESNFRMLQETLLELLGARAPRVFRMEAEREDLEAAARDYEALLPAALDVVLLGLGEDGHTASLFPGAQVLKERTRRVAAVEDSPKPPPRRLTLTLPALEAARALLGVATGQGKRQAVEALRAGGDIPAARVPRVVWMVDPAAAG